MRMQPISIVKIHLLAMSKLKQSLIRQCFTKWDYDVGAERNQITVLQKKHMVIKWENIIHSLIYSYIYLFITITYNLHMLHDFLWAKH